MGGQWDIGTILTTERDLYFFYVGVFKTPGCIE